MAQGMQRNIIDDFANNVTQLIQEAAAYASGGEPDEETESNIRKLRILSAALNSALQSIQFMPRPMAAPPQPPEPPVEPEPQAHAATGAGMARQATPATPPPRR